MFYGRPLDLQSSKALHPEGKGERWELLVSGADVLDGTPIYDIKPYLSFSDSHEDAKNGFADETKDYRLRVEWYPSEGVHSRNCLDIVSILSRDCLVNGSKLAAKRLVAGSFPRREIEYILSQDPRPGYQEDPEREYKMDYAGWRVTFKVKNAEKESSEPGVVIVTNVEKI